MVQGCIVQYQWYILPTFWFILAVEDFFINKYYEQEEHEILQKNILTTDAMSFIDCARTCTSNIDCYGFEYKPDDLTCRIVSSITIGSGKVTYFVKCT